MTKTTFTIVVTRDDNWTPLDFEELHTALLAQVEDAWGYGPSFALSWVTHEA